MKQKDIVYMLLAVVILLGAGYLAYTQLMPKKAGAKTVEVEKIGQIPDHLDETGLKWLNDPTKVVDYALPVDLTGLDNQDVFGH